LKVGNTLTLARRRRQIIKSNVFVSKDARVSARGASSSADGKQVFEVSSTSERLLLSGSPQSAGDVWIFTVPPPTK
jgi:hypothetical protein